MRKSAAIVFFLSTVVMSVAAQAQTMAGSFSYVTTLSAQDHFNSNGERLTTPGAIIRQDRANFWKGEGDYDDQEDPAFSVLRNRATLGTIVDSAPMSPATRRAILNGEPRVLVIVRNYSVTVRILSSR